MKRKNRTNHYFHARVFRFEQVHGIATDLDWFIALLAPVVIGQRKYEGIYFATRN